MIRIGNSFHRATSSRNHLTAAAGSKSTVSAASQNIKVLFNLPPTSVNQKFNLLSTSNYNNSMRNFHCQSIRSLHRASMRSFNYRTTNKFRQPQITLLYSHNHRCFSFGVNRIRGNPARFSGDGDGRSMLLFLVGTMLFTYGFTWCCVPLYRMYCQSVGQGAADSTGHKDYDAIMHGGDISAEELASLSEEEQARYLKIKKKVDERIIKIMFQGTVHETLHWEFRPQQKHLWVAPGETALAFYRAKNLSKEPIIGNSVYSVLPADAGIYFNKIQCFCFDEQLINPDEEVDLPILFYVDPEFATDNRTAHVNDITLSYFFFHSDSEIPEEYEELQRLRDIQKERNQLRADGVLPPLMIGGKRAEDL